MIVFPSILVTLRVDKYCICNSLQHLLEIAHLEITLEHEAIMRE